MAPLKVRSKEDFGSDVNDYTCTLERNGHGHFPDNPLHTPQPSPSKSKSMNRKSLSRSFKKCDHGAEGTSPQLIVSVVVVIL